MTTWTEFRNVRPDLADAGRALLYQFGVGLFALLIPSPKLADLRRDGRYALHSFPCPQNEDAFHVTGSAAERDDPDVRRAIDAVFLAEREWSQPPPGFREQTLVEFFVERCLVTRTTGHGDPAPQHTVWRAPGQ
jgi:hypothetical protein